MKKFKLMFGSMKQKNDKKIWFLKKYFYPTFSFQGVLDVMLTFKKSEFYKKYALLRHCRQLSFKLLFQTWKYTVKKVS